VGVGRLGDGYKCFFKEALGDKHDSTVEFQLSQSRYFVDKTCLAEGDKSRTRRGI